MSDGGALDLLLKAHYRAALDNDNVSSAVLKQTAAVGESFEKSVAAALLTLGGKIHGPTKDARYVIFKATDSEIRARLKLGERLPGLGNQFYRDRIDPAFASFFGYIETNHHDVWKRLIHITSLVSEEKGKFLYPNAACATAICAELMNLAEGTEIQLLIIGRMPAWAEQWANQKLS